MGAGKALFQIPGTARTAGGCGRTGGTKTPVLSTCFFFILRRAIEIGPNLLRKPLVGQGLSLPRRRAHSALQRGTWGVLCALCQERLRLLPPLPLLQAERLLLVAVIYRRLDW